MGKFSAFNAINSLCQSNDQNNPLVSQLRHFLSLKSWSPDNRQSVLNVLSELVLNRELRPQVVSLFAPILSDLLFRCKHKTLLRGDLFVALSDLIGYYPNATHFAYQCFQTSLFSPSELLDSRTNDQHFALNILISCFNYLHFNPLWFRDAIDWSFVLQYTSHPNADIRYIAIQCHRLLFAINDTQFECLFKQEFTDEEVTRLRVEYLCLFCSRIPSIQLKNTLFYEICDEKSSDSRYCFDDNDLSEDIVSVEGVLINRFVNNSESIDGKSLKYNNKIVLLPTTQSNIRSLALGVAYGKPVLIEGPIGCGKTLLIEYISSLSGRHKAPHLMKVQMGDQIDAKMLIGSHICTDIPGEFIWKAGPLTQAMKYGYWLLLEDIDCAPSDVISMLMSVLESNSLSSLPGCENHLNRVHNDFRIFFTRRLIGSQNSDLKHSEFAIKSSNYYNCINKLCYKISLNLLSREELQSLICKKWLNLSPISERILDIYYFLQTDSQDNGLKRQISLRDLMKWCQRISKDFKLNSDESATKAFLDSNDCFLQSISNPTLRKTKAEVIGSHLNITQSQSEYLCCKRKPELIVNDKLFRIGRFSANLKERQINLLEEKKSIHTFALTHQSLSLLERISVAIGNKEPVLLCGETGTGKTSCVQYLAKRLHKSLTVINMNQQSDSSDLLGGYKPIDINIMMGPIKDEYLDLFSISFETDKNVSFLTKFTQIYKSEDWSTLFKVMLRVYESALTKCKDNQILERWKALGDRINRLQSYKVNQKGCLAFSFIEGSLVKAMRSGHWILLDEINLAESETLQCLSAILDSDEGSIALLDKADNVPVERNPEFRLFACMNPATDVGKKELPLGIRNRFTELFVDQLEDKSDLRILIHSYIGKYVSPNLIEAIVSFYLQMKTDSKTVLTDSNGMRPHYSLRTLCRALSVAAINPCAIVMRSLYESFCLSFLTRLDRISRIKVENDIQKSLFGSKESLNVIKGKIQAPKSPEKYECIEGYYILRGPKEPKTNVSYILTETVEKNLKDICRIVSIGKTFPVLLEGETSVGKTSLIEWLAAATGNVCLRINNHEHTDLQEYVGSYCVDTEGKLVFREGVLAEAMRNGYWIILDELNLAPTDVLEALNRVLDDNRELFIPETQQLIKANPKFLLLATQNPAGHYGGRKALSRAFRNRFVELHFNEIPSEELEIILHQRCSLPLSYAKRMVGVLHDLQIRRRESGVFAGKHGFITLRDLFRWGERYKKFAKQHNQSIQFYDWDLNLANDGYMLLAGRVRRSEEVALIQSVLETRFKRKLDTNSLFNDTLFLNNFSDHKEFQHIVWNKSFKRLGTLLSEAIKYNEPVLLVGETGCGKTSICQLFAALHERSLYSVNCHMNTESADFLGSLRPVRNFDNEGDIKSSRPLFEWVDGPLVDAMKSGHYFMVDEISLADDSVLERLNSVLEPERTLLLAENNNTFDTELSIPVIKAKESFRYMATMNPGGDYGKKELSPALRNRFTEIWCPPYEDIDDIKDIICHNLGDKLTKSRVIVCQSMCDFIVWFNTNVNNSKRLLLSIRDILSWVQFINLNTQSKDTITMSLSDAFINGGLLVFVDAIGSAGSAFNSNIKNSNSIRNECQQYLNQLSVNISAIDSQIDMLCDNTIDDMKYFTIKPFCITKGPEVDVNIDNNYMWNSPTVQTNALRVVRAMQLPKPILLEGMPGVGKTTLIQALAKASGHRLIRINLSEQTDISDLFGADLPVEGEDSIGKFAFRDGPLLQALKSEWTWILLDELNLAQQSVLEGLNACLDHRNEIFISELNKSFKISKTMTRIFATQNPYSEGGARKGLPRSLLNRFTSVYMQSLTTDDYIFILSNLFPKVQQSVIRQMVAFNNEVIHQIVIENKFGQRGSPWEFNLRELIRWAQLMTRNVIDLNQVKPEKYVKFLYIDKMRTIDDKNKMKEICDKYYPNNAKSNENQNLVITDNYLQIGNSFVNRRRILSNELTNYVIFESQKQYLQSLMKCIEMNWMSILIGDSGVGKTSVVKLLSDLTGHKLRVFAVNSEMDTMDLLGGFEQKDLLHHLTHIEDIVSNLCLKAFGKYVEPKDKMTEIMQLWTQMQTLNSNDESSNVFISEKLDFLNQITDKLEKLNDSEVIITSELKHKMHSLKAIYNNKVLVSGAFEWRDSILIRALVAGDWLLIDNANLCSASVLDRLNGLLEPNGELTINEKGSIDGQLTTIKPHPDFRLILAMNPLNGELSRAMRNRGIEIFMFPIDTKQDIIKQLNGLVKSDDNIVDFLVKCSDQLSDNFNFSLFTEYTKSLVFQLQNGFKPEICLKEFYSKLGMHSIDDQELHKYVNNFVANNLTQKSQLNLNNFKYDSITSCVVEDSRLLESSVNERDNWFESKELNSDSLEKYSTGLRVYLEKSCLKDLFIRYYIFKKHSVDQCFTESFQLVKQIGDNTQQLIPKSFNLSDLSDFQIDLRYNSNLWQLLLNSIESFDNNIELIEKNLNRFAINMFWNQLKCQQLSANQSTGKELVSFMTIASQLIDGKLSRNSYPKVFVSIYHMINEIESQLMNATLALCPTNDDFLLLRDIVLWVHQLIALCHQNYPKTELSNQFISNKFTILWIVINEKSLSILQTYLNIDLNMNITSVNQLLGIDSFDPNKTKYKTLLSLTNNCLVFKTQETSSLFVSYKRLCDDLFRANTSKIGTDFKDIILLISDNISQLISGQYNSIHLKKDISLIEQMLQNLSNVDIDSEDNTDFIDIINRRKLMANNQLEPMFVFSLLYSEVSYFNEISNDFCETYLKLIETKHFTLNPLHISCINLSQNLNTKPTDLKLHHLLEFNQNFTINKVLKHLALDLNETETKATIFDDKLLLLTADCVPLISLMSSYLLSNNHISIGLLSEKLSQFSQLKQFLTLNYKHISDTKNNSLNKHEFEFVRNCFSLLVQNVCLNSPIKKSSLSVTTDDFRQLFNQISLLIQETKDPFDESIVLIFVGYITSQILCPTFPIDPIERINCKLNHYIIDLKLINAEIDVRNAYSVIKSNDESIESSDHSLIQGLVERKRRLELKIKRLESNLPYRSSCADYFKLKADCIQFLETVVSKKSIDNYTKKFISCYRQTSNQKDIKTLINESIGYQSSIQSFVRKIQLSYPLYQDLVNSFLMGVCILLKGFKNATFHLQTKNLAVNDLKLKSVDDMNSSLKIMGQFCDTNSPSFIANYLCQPETVNKIKRFSIISELNFERNISTLLRSALIEIHNEMAVNYSDSLALVSYRIFNVFVKCWQNVREEEELKREEEEALFEFKMKTECSDMTDEERDRHELEAIFPTISEQYFDVSDEFAVDDTIENNLIKSKIEDQMIADVISSHLKIVDSIDKSEKLEPNFRKAYLLRHSVISQITKRLGVFFDFSIDSELIDGQMIACDESIADINDNCNESLNIYHNSSLYEINVCYKTLEKMEKRIITELLPQFENHPILIKLLKIIQKVFDLSAKEPLIKFATGLEVLLQASQDWQLMAHKGISLADNLNEITQMLISWRKLELKCWSECLDSVNKDIEDKQLNIFWFHLYITITALMDNKNCDQNEIKEFVVSIKKFIENSKLGEFKVRLNLLQTFASHIRSIDKNNFNNNSLYNSLQNLYQFYTQFMPNIEKSLMNVRKPIEKEVKEFVKITKWSENNFWSVKSAVDKSHKQLFKYMKKYRSELNQTVIAALVIDNMTNDSNFLPSNWRLSVKTKDLFVTENIDYKPMQGFISEYSFLDKSVSLTKKSRHLIRKSVKNASIIVKQINAIENFSSDIIMGAKELSALQVPIDIKDKTKWKKSANHIQNRKRRALSELFKSLAQFGLSYRKGLVIESNIDINEIIMLTGSLNFDTKPNSSLSLQLADDLSSCNKYFYKCLARFASLRLSLESPNKQLSIGSIERIKGFSAQIMKRVVDRRQSLIQNLNFYIQLKEIQQNLFDLIQTSDQMVVIPKQVFKEYLTSVQKIIVSIVSFILRSIDLLNSLSTSTEETVLLLSSQNMLNISDQNINELKYSLNFYNSKLNEMISQTKRFDLSSDLSVNSLKDLFDLKDIYSTLKNLLNELKDCYSHQTLCDLKLNTKFSVLFNETNELTTKFDTKLQFYMTDSCDDCNVNDLSAKQSIKTIKTVLSSIETIYKLFNESNNQNLSEDLLENVFNISDTKNVLKDLQIKATFNAFSKLISLTNTNWESNESSVKMMQIFAFRAQILKNIYPFLENYVNLLQYFLTLSVSSLRTNNKLLSILLSLFSELSQNGFCLPEEPSDESNDKDMGTELKDIQDGGLGEGEGTKDVSDKIESEDQLEDAMKEGSKEEGKGDQNDGDIEEEENGIEMENDFDGQMYSPSKADNEDDKGSDGDESDDNLEDQMGDVDNNSEVLDEKIWGSDEEDSDSEQSDGDDDETGFGGKDTIEDKVVAKDENKDLPKDKDFDENREEKDENESDLEINENENELQNDEYSDERIDPYKDMEPKVDKSKEELPENMELDDNEDNEDNEESAEPKDDISVSGENSGESENEDNLDMNDNEEEMDESIDNKDEDKDKTEDFDNKVEENTLNEDLNEEQNEEITSEEKESKPDKKQGIDSTNDETYSADNIPKQLENENNAKKSSDVCVDENAEQNTEPSVGETEEQHGFNQSLVGDNSAQPESQQLQSSAALDDSESTEEKFQQNNKRDKTRRTLADNYDKSVKRQKVMQNDIQNNTNNDSNTKDDSEKQTIESKLYRHVDNILNANNKVIDIASNEEKEIQNDDNELETKDNIDLDKPQEMDVEEKNELIDTLTAIDVKSEKLSEKSKNNSETNKEELSDELMETEGEVIATHTVQRGNESTFHTTLDNEMQESNETSIIEKRFDDLSVKTIKSLDINSVIDVWKECEAKVSPLVYELCERLQLVLEPTKMAKLRGDYRTGKRLNMRKVIAYIASDFRKDKIWLRRTKASKRQFQIIIAIDDSSSMSDNKSKQLAFESLALLGKSLTLLEAGELAIMSFGQTVRLLHNFNDSFNESTGANLLTQLTFEQNETRIADLLQSAVQLMATTRRPTGGQKEDISQLLIIVSDGRGIYSEGEQRVRQSIRQLKELGIFVVFVVIDNPLNKDSILDIRVPIFNSSGTVKIESYMERFPFQFYILLRDINGLPVVMGEALRQWFELITSGQT